MSEPARGFRPRLWPTLFALPTLIVLLGLGTWQLERRAWKMDLITALDARITAAPVELPQPLDDLAAFEYRPVTLHGSYLHDHELYLGARPYKGTVGQHVVTPFRLDDGRLVLIDRGWIPDPLRDPATRRDSAPAGPVTQEALVRRGGWKGSSWFQPANDAAGNLWLWMDLPAMAKAAGLEGLETGFYLEARAGQHPGTYPVGGQTRVVLRNDHLQYALTWYALAVVLLIIYLLFHRRQPRRGAPRG